GQCFGPLRSAFEVRLTEEHPLQCPKEVGRTEQDTYRAGDGHPAGEQSVNTFGVESADNDEHFADECREPRKTQRGKKGNGYHHGIPWHQRGQSTEMIDSAVVYPVVKHTYEEKQGGRQKPVADHLE